MNCAVHTGVEATGYCRNCGKAMCPACTRQVRDVLYCEDCLAGVMGLSPVQAVAGVGASPSSPMPLPPALPTKASSNPGVAFCLGFIPGLGAIYNGEYNKALIHIVVFAALIVGLSSDPDSGVAVTLSLLLAGFVFYMAIDAMRTARARLDGAGPPDAAKPPGQPELVAAASACSDFVAAPSEAGGFLVCSLGGRSFSLP